MSSVELWAVDTSVALAALDAGHSAHGECMAAVRQRRPALSGHAAFDVYSVLTRMPGQLGVDPVDAAGLIDRVFPEALTLSPSATVALRTRLAVVGISGGAVYDALVAEAARTNGRRLLTRDRRAQRTYDLLGTSHTFVGL